MNWSIARMQVWELWRMTRAEIGQRAAMVVLGSLFFFGGSHLPVEDGLLRALFPALMSISYLLLLLC